MDNSVFKNVLQDNEKILFEAGVNKKAFLLKTNLSVFMWITLALMIFSFVVVQTLVKTVENTRITYNSIYNNWNILRRSFYFSYL